LCGFGRARLQYHQAACQFPLTDALNILALAAAVTTRVTPHLVIRAMLFLVGDGLLMVIPGTWLAPP
jgi:hypothetical protein